MDRRKLPATLSTSDDYDRTLWGEILSLHGQIEKRLHANTVDLYETGRLAEQMARRLGRLHSLRIQVTAHQATLRGRDGDREP